MSTCLDRVQDWLREQHVAYSTQHHRQALTPQELTTMLHEKACQAASTVVVQVDSRLILLVVPVGETVSLRQVAELLGAEAAALASDSDCEHYFPDCEFGAVPPFGSLHDVPVYLDETLMRSTKLIFLVGNHHHSLKLATEDYLRVAKPLTARLTRSQARAKVPA
jgi:Ala-tRNA(Pro) deacylase